MAGIGIYFERYFQESSIAILRKPDNLYLFECLQMLSIICFSILTVHQKTIVPVYELP
jgi:hypothetical protein